MTKSGKFVSSVKASAFPSLAGKTESRGPGGLIRCSSVSYVCLLCFYYGFQALHFFEFLALCLKASL